VVEEYNIMRKTVFDNIVNDENDFTELLCNMMKFKEFENTFSDFLGLNNKNIDVNTQYRTEKNGIPDLVITYNDGIVFVEVKIGNSRLTKNQPKGYIEELLDKQEKNKALYFLVPINYNYKDELENRIKKFKNPAISNIEPKYWEVFFYYCKQNKIFYKNKTLFEYYNLLKAWFGYEAVVFNKEEQNIMKRNIKKMSKVGKFLEGIYAQLMNKGYKLKTSEGLTEIGIFIYDKKKKGVYYGWIGIWFSLWEEKNDCLIYTIDNMSNKKYFNNFAKKYKYKGFKKYDPEDDDNPDEKTIHGYICFDDKIFKNKYNQEMISNEISTIIRNIKSTK
jgi:hypothetical protein